MQIDAIYGNIIFIVLQKKVWFSLFSPCCISKLVFFCFRLNFVQWLLKVFIHVFFLNNYFFFTGTLFFIKFIFILFPSFFIVIRRNLLYFLFDLVAKSKIEQRQRPLAVVHSASKLKSGVLRNVM
jgi:hypothetical protein